MSHTQGPWRVLTLDDGTEWIQAGCVRIAIVDDSAGCQPGNAALIAAAPEMLRALEAAREFISNGVEFGYIWMPEDGDPALETSGIIEAAIRKARGEE